MDGDAVCKTLKNDSDTAALPIVILTARGEPSERVHRLEIGADDYMTKPFSPRELVLRVRLYCGAHAPAHKMTCWRLMIFDSIKINSISGSKGGDSS